MINLGCRKKMRVGGSKKITSLCAVLEQSPRAPRAYLRDGAIHSSRSLARTAASPARGDCARVCGMTLRSISLVSWISLSNYGTGNHFASKNPAVFISKAQVHKVQP